MAVHQQRQGMLRNHQFLIRRYDIDGDATGLRRYQARMSGILGGIECHAEPAELLCHTSADAARVFADAGREDEGIEALKRSGEHAGVETDAIGEVIDRELRLWIGARLELA